jgi:hypothetical protein
MNSIDHKSISSPYKIQINDYSMSVLVLGEPEGILDVQSLDSCKDTSYRRNYYLISGEFPLI